MEASTMNPKLRHSVPSRHPIYEATRWNKSVYTDSKSRMPGRVFFPQVSNTDLEDIGHTAYPDPVAFPIIDIEEIQKAIFKFLSQSAPGTDNIPNKILKTGLLFITPCLHWLFNSSLNLRYCPRHFRDSITIFF